MRAKLDVQSHTWLTGRVLPVPSLAFSKGSLKYLDRDLLRDGQPRERQLSVHLKCFMKSVSCWILARGTLPKHEFLKVGNVKQLLWL